MRKDVKVGLVLSLVVVIVAGLYYVGRDKKADPIKLDDAPAVADKSASPKPALADARDNRVKPGANRAVTPGRPVVPPPNSRVGPKPAGSTGLTPPSEGSGSTAAKPEAVKSEPPGPGPEPKPSPAIASGAKADSSAADTSAGKEPVAAVTPASDAFNNVFKFGKDANDPAAGDTSTGKPAGAHTFPSSTDSKSGVAPTGADASRTAPPGPTRATDSGEPVRTHKVERGDSYSLLAETYYGSQRFTQFLIDANPQYADPTKLREGVLLKIPSKPNEPAVAPAHKASAAPAAGDGAKASNDRLYVVQEEDTLYAIANRELGKGSRWPELLELNKEVLKGSPERLRVGQKLKLPTTEKLDSPKKP